VGTNFGSWVQLKATRQAAANGRSMTAASALLMALCAVAANASAAPAAGVPGKDWVAGRVLVMPRAGLPDSELGKIVGQHHGKARKIGASGLYIVDLPAGVSEADVADQLAHHPHLKFAELDRRVPAAAVPNDPYMGSEWHLNQIGVPAALDVAQGAGVTIAVLDTGVDCTHPDLAANCVAGWNFYDNNSNTTDVNGHGTTVAGAAAAATNNGVGVASVAGKARIMPIRIADPSAYASWSTVAQGITYAADHGARIANLSYSNMAGSATIQSAAQYMKSKGGLVVVSAGNNGVDEGVAATTSMIPVSATDSNDQITSWSSFGSFVAVAAPGLNIYTTGPSGSYWTCWGTSFAAPITAGTLALMMSAKPTMANTQIESLLYSTAVDLGAAGRDKYYGYGRINAASAVKAVAATTTTTDTQAPTAAISAPLASASVSGLVTVNVSANDNVGVVRVDLRVNGQTVASDVTSPFGFTWDSTKTANGMANLTAVAYDAAGNVGSSTSVAVNVANAAAAPTADTTAPVVAITSPAAGRVQSKGSVTVTASASDNSGAAGITQRLYIDGVLVSTVNGASLSYGWNLNKLATGSHALKVVANDAANNTSTVTTLVTK
jgi:thermitase